MNRRRTALLQAGLKTLYYSGAHRMLAPLTQGAGIIFTLHHVEPGEPAAFSPNRILSVTPEFLSAVIGRVQDAGLDIVSLDEMRERLLHPRDGGRFACFTIDDGYADNLRHAHPVFEKHDAPYAIYLMTGLPDRSVALWWRTLEEVLATQDEVVVTLGGEEQRFATATTDDKYEAYETIYWHLRSLGVAERRDFVSAMAAAAGIDEQALVARMGLSWDEVRGLDANPLVTIGAHTLTHPALSQIGEAEASYEMAESRRVIAQELGERPRHFAYPYGSRDAAATARVRARQAPRLRDRRDDQARASLPRARAEPVVAAARLAERRLSGPAVSRPVPDRRAVRARQPLPQGDGGVRRRPQASPPRDQRMIHMPGSTQAKPATAK